MDKHELLKNKTENVLADDIQAFRRSSVIQRSPEENQMLKDNTGANVSIRTSQVYPEHAQSTASEPKQAKDVLQNNTPTTHFSCVSNRAKRQSLQTSAVAPIEKSRAGEIQGATTGDKKLHSTMKELGEAIDSLLVYYKGRHNVHHEIKKIGSLIKRRHTEAMMVMEESEKRLATPSIGTPVTQKKTPTTQVLNGEKGRMGNSIAKSAKRIRARISPTTAVPEIDMVVEKALSSAAKKGVQRRV